MEVGSGGMDSEVQLRWCVWPRFDPFHKLEAKFLSRIAKCVFESKITQKNVKVHYWCSHCSQTVQIFLALFGYLRLYTESVHSH